jgi:signal transduction histidine kinase
LRRAIEAVRATLNVDLVLRAIGREGLRLVGGDEAMLIVRPSQLDLPDVYRTVRGSQDTSLERGILDPSDATLLERTTNEVQIVTRGDPVADLLLDAHKADAVAGARISGGDGTAVLFVFARHFARGSERLLQAFAEGAAVALAQARLFMQLGLRNDEIASQKQTLEDRNRVIRDIVYALAHDLRTPLAASNLTVTQALDGAYGDLPPAYREVLRTMLASNADLRRLVDTLLLVARFESGESSTLRERIAVADEAMRVTRELQPVAEVKGVALTCEATPAAVEGDGSELRRAIGNLIANAIEATPAGGHVNVRVGSDDHTVAISVEDDGYGVAPEQRERLFARFAPGARALGGGTGLGLYIVRLIAQKLGGSVTHADRAPHGSVFTIALPAAGEAGSNA